MRIRTYGGVGGREGNNPAYPIGTPGMCRVLSCAAGTRGFRNSSSDYVAAVRGALFSPSISPGREPFPAMLLAQLPACRR